jgi:hypothetical protein
MSGPSLIEKAALRASRKWVSVQPAFRNSNHYCNLLPAQTKALPHQNEVLVTFRLAGRVR